MSVLIVRHGLSRANDRNSAAFGQPDAELMPAGIEQARASGQMLEDVFGINPLTEPAAASRLYRGKQPALVAGFTAIREYAALNEVDVPKTPELREMLDNGIIIPEAYRAAEAVMENPPVERVWYGHGYLWAALCEITGVDTSEMRFIPRFGEVRELPIEPGQPV